MRLLQIYQPFMSAVSLISEGCVPQQPDNLRQQLTALLLQAEEAVIKQGWSKVWSTEAAFAVCVWADERLLLSSIANTSPWVPLQSQLYQTHCGGEEFFTRLETLFSRCPLIDKQHPTRAMLEDVLRVFGACLAAGFKGRYYHDEAHYLRQLQQRIAEQLGITQGPVAFEILREDSVQRSAINQWRLFDPFSILLMGVALLATLLVVLIYQDLLATDLVVWPD